MDRLDLDLLRCFFQVAREQSVSRASARLHLSQPAVSLRIKKLEEQIGHRLFRRHNRGLLPTAAGRRALAYAERILALTDEMLKAVESETAEPVGTIRVGTYTTASSYLLAPALGAFFRKYPQVRVDFAYGDTEEMLIRLKRLELECVVASDVPAQPGLVVERILEDEMILVASGTPNGIPDRIEPRDLEGMPFVGYPIRYDYCYRNVERRFGRHLKRTRLVLSSESFDTIRQAVLAGSGVTFIPRYLVRDELARGRLRRVRVGRTRLPFTFSFVTAAGHPESAAVRVFRDHVVRELRTS